MLTTTRPLGLFSITSVDVNKVVEHSLCAVPRRTGRILGSYLRNSFFESRHPEFLSRRTRSRYIECLCSADGILHIVGILYFFELLLTGLMLPMVVHDEFSETRNCFL